MALSRQKVKLKDIAETANLSVSTVSMALANRPQINEETKARVRQISQELGYSRSKKLGLEPSDNNGTNNRPRRATKRFGYLLIGSSLDDEASMILAHRIGTCANKLGVRLELSATDTDPAIEGFTAEVQEHVVEHALEFAQGLDGLLLCGYVTHNLVNALKETEIPFVNIGGLMDNGQYLSQPACHIVSTNWIEAGRRVIAKLTEWGHEKIGYFTEQLPRGMSCDLWLQGYKMGLIDAGLPINDSWIHISGKAFTGGVPAAEAMAAMPDRPTAYLSTDIRCAATFVSTMRNHGIEIGPRDLIMSGHKDLARKYHMEEYPLIYLEDGLLAESGLRRLAELWDRPWPSPSITFLPFSTHNM